MTYNAREYKYKVDSQGDTTITSDETEKYTFEILEEKKDAYKVRLTYSDFWTSDTLVQKIHDAVFAKCGPSVVEFETNEMGTFKQLLNTEELVKYMKASVQPTVDMMWKSMDEEERNVISKKKLRKYIESLSSNPSTVTTAVLDDIGRFLFFHGVRLDLYDTYSMEEPISNLFDNAETITGSTSLWVDDELTDEYSTVCRTYTKADANSMLSTILEEMTKAFAGKKQVTQELRDSIASGMQDVNALLEQYSAEEIHLDTGWPLSLYLEKVISIEQNSSKRTISGIVRKVDMIFEEEKE